MWDKPMRKKAKRGRFPRKMLSRSRAPYSLFPGFQCGQHLFGKGGTVPHHGVMGRIIPQGVVLGGGIGAFLPSVGLFQLVRRDKQIDL